MSEPLRMTFDVGCSPEQSFDLWSSRTSTWWPASHTVSAQPNARVIIEPGVGGRIYERTPEGDEHDWGQVTCWEPPDRIAYLWHLRQDRADASEVEITFAAGARDGTTVSIEHRGWERLGARGTERRQQNQHGWTTLLPHFQAAARDLDRSATPPTTNCGRAIAAPFAHPCVHDACWTPAHRSSSSWAVHVGIRSNRLRPLIR
jgi:uncharacterized protein YndB with AHSA1/START domain